MKIILVSKDGRLTGSRSLSFLSLFGGFFAVMLGAVAAAGWYGYGLGELQARSQMAAKPDDPKTREQVLRDLLIEQKQSLQAEQTRTRENLDALALRLGRMQAHILRLDALGERLVEQGKLDKEEFDFDREPAMGGVEKHGDTRSIAFGELVGEMEKLQASISDREHKLDLLEALMLDKRINEEMLPAGRPVEKGWLSSKFGYRKDPFTGKQTLHEGIDIASKEGNEVLAVAAGVVVWAGDKNGYGNLVEIQHADGYITRYGHNKSVLVKPGDIVERGKPIALVGSSGRSTGPHVHFEVVRNGEPLDPADFLRRKG